MKSIFTSRTFWFNVIGGLVAVGDQVAGSGLLGPWALVGANAANIFLRTITKDAVTWGTPGA
jgi:hypothetical protein